MIDPFQCTRCNAPLVVVDAPSLVCRYCGALNEVSEAYREELRLSRDLDETTRRAIEEWARLDRIRVPRWWFVSTATTPFVLIVAGFSLALTLGILKTVSSMTLPWLVGIWVWFPLVPFMWVASRIGMRNLLVSGVARIGVQFAAIPSASASEGLNCRLCGARLTVQADDILVRCLYCGGESIVRLDESQMHSLETNVGTAKVSLVQAMAMLSKRVHLAAVETRGRLGVIAGLVVWPLIWSFASTVQSSYWSLFIALDVWVLSICVFWTMREAFLPPVTLEELDSLWAPSPENSKESTTEERRQLAERVAGTRGWYDHAFEAVNFLVPLLVAMLFVAIQAIVLRTR